MTKAHLLPTPAPAGAPSPAPGCSPSANAGAGFSSPRRGPVPRAVSRAVMAGLRHYRQVAGLSLAKAALASGYSRQTIHLWEVGKHAPTRFAVAVLAEVYGTTVEAILSHYPRQEFRARRVGPLVAVGDEELPVEVERVVGAPHL